MTTGHPYYESVDAADPDLSGLPDLSGVDASGVGGSGPDDNLSARLRSRVRLTTRTTLTLIAGVLIAVGFVGGLLVQKNFGAGSTATAATFPGGPGGFGGGFGGPGGASAGPGGTNAAAGAGTTGTVKLVDGTTVYLTTAAGDTITVKTSAATALRLAQSVALKDLPVGATVTVQGTTGTDGAITATTVTAQK